MTAPAPFIPPRTRAELASPAPPGQRHEQAMKIALSLLGQGFVPEAVSGQLRSMYSPDFADKEIQSVIAWAVSKSPGPCGYKTRTYHARPSPLPVKPGRVTADEAIANTKAWLRGFHCDVADLWHASPWRPLEDWRFDSIMLFAALYGKDERVNIVTEHTQTQQADGSQKANPARAGVTRTRDEWMTWIRDNGTPQSEAGAWIRLNPVKQTGSGSGGAVTDNDVTAFRFCLLESDDVPAELQLSLWTSLPLPVAAIIDSAGRSVHAWVRVDCTSGEEYRVKVARIYSLLARFGLCSNNKNPSRMSRLPGAVRKLGKVGVGEQRLLYLDDAPHENPIFERGR